MRPKIGDRVNRLVVKKILSKDKWHKLTFECICDCGRIVNVRENMLLKGQMSCGCYKKEQLSQRCWTGFGEISGDYWSIIQRNAKSRNIDFDITIEYCWNLFLQQNRQCNLSGLDIGFSRSIKKDPFTASLDRINSSESYKEYNIQWLHKDINNIKKNFNQQYFIDLCYSIAKFNNSKLYFNDTNNYDINKTILYRVKHGADTRKLEFKISLKDIIKQFENQNGICLLTGAKLNFNTNTRTSDGNASLDRIDSNIGYTKENIRWIHKHINLSKWEYTDSYYNSLCRKVYEHSIADIQ